LSGGKSKKENRNNYQTAQKLDGKGFLEIVSQNTAYPLRK
jgi:hypothetical protein